MFQTELVCGIICNLAGLALISRPKMFQTELVCGIICNYKQDAEAVISYKFQTELVCGIICNQYLLLYWGNYQCFKPSWFVV